MNRTSDFKHEKLSCPLKTCWVSFRLVSESGESHAFGGLSFKLHTQYGETVNASLDEDGYYRLDSLYHGPLILEMAATATNIPDAWYEHLQLRDAFPLPISQLQVTAEQTPIGPRNPAGKTWLAEERALQEGAQFYRVEVSDFVSATKHLPDPDAEWGPRPSALLKSAMGEPGGADNPGIALLPNRHHVLEVKALRAYSPLFSLSPEFCALNAYHLSVMSVLSYAPFSTHQKPYKPSPPPYTLPGSIGHVLREQLARQIKPTLFDSSQYHLLCEEVAYSKRLEVVPYDPERYAGEDTETPEEVHFLNHEDSHTQAFVTHNDKMILITIRGTETNSLADWLTDLDASQVAVEGLDGKAHRGFANAFHIVKKFVERYLERFFTGKQTIMVCGHSLGGAIALLLAEHLRNKWTANICLYTFGAPRAGNSTFVASAEGLVHHRLVNHNDPIPAVPFRWMDMEWKVMLPGTLILLVSSSPMSVGALVMGGMVNLSSDKYQHHGQQYHYMPRKRDAGSEAHVLWQPESDTIEMEYGALATAKLAIEADMPRRRHFIGQLFAYAEHFGGPGYTTAALANLLRLNASLERGGQLFTEQEREDLQSHLNDMDEYLAHWQAASYSEFRHRLRTRHYASTYAMTDTQLRELYRGGVDRAAQEQRNQRSGLTLPQDRLITQARQKVTGRHVFGDLMEHEELEQLLSEWRALAEVAQAESMVLRYQQHPRAYA